MVLLDLLHVQRAGFFKFLKIGIDKELSQLNINVDNTRLQVIPFFDTLPKKSLEPKVSIHDVVDLTGTSQKDRKQKKFGVRNQKFPAYLRSSVQPSTTMLRTKSSICRRLKVEARPPLINHRYLQRDPKGVLGFDGKQTFIPTSLYVPFGSFYKTFAGKHRKSKVETFSNLPFYSNGARAVKDLSFARYFESSEAKIQSSKVLKFSSNILSYAALSPRRPLDMQKHFIHKTKTSPFYATHQIVGDGPASPSMLSEGTYYAATYVRRSSSICRRPKVKYYNSRTNKLFISSNNEFNLVLTKNQNSCGSCFRLIASKYTPREAIIYQKSWSCKLVVKVLLTVYEKKESKKRNTSSFFVLGQNKQAPKQLKNKTDLLDFSMLSLPCLATKMLRFTGGTKSSMSYYLQILSKTYYYAATYKSSICRRPKVQIEDLSSTKGSSSYEVSKNTICIPTENSRAKEPKAEFVETWQQKTSQRNQKRDHELFLILGELPLMTKRGHFIVHGSPRVILSQLIRTPGIYFTQKNNELQADCVPEQGPWLCIYKNFSDSSPVVDAPPRPNTNSSSQRASVQIAPSTCEARPPSIELRSASVELSEASTKYASETKEHLSNQKETLSTWPLGPLEPKVDHYVKSPFGEEHSNSKDLSFVDSLLYSNYNNKSKSSFGQNRETEDRDESKIQRQASYFCYTKQFSTMPFSLVYSTFQVFELHSQFTEQTLLLTKLKTLEKIRKFKEIITSLLTFTWKKRVRRRLQKLYTKRCFISTQQFEKTKLLFRLKKKLILGPLSRKSFNEKLGMSSCINTGVAYNAFDNNFFGSTNGLLKTTVGDTSVGHQTFGSFDQPAPHVQFNATSNYYAARPKVQIEDKLGTSSVRSIEGGRASTFSRPKVVEGSMHQIESKLLTQLCLPAVVATQQNCVRPLGSLGLDQIAISKKNIKPTFGSFSASYRVRDVGIEDPSKQDAYDLRSSPNLPTSYEVVRSIESKDPWLNSTNLLSRDLSLIVRFLDGYKFLPPEDIDDLNNQRIRTPSDQIQQQVRIGLFRFKKMFVKLISSGGTSQTITDFLNGALREFFGSNPLSQFLDQTNPLAEITHKRRISKLGLNGIQRESATLKVRTIHSTYFGRICPIETPEGINAGLVNSLTCLSRVDQRGQLVTPLSILVEGQKQEQFFYYSNKEDSALSTTDTALLKFHRLPNQFIYTKNESQFQQLEPNKVKVRVKSDLQTISLATALIPFLAYDDANRALMGSNMQRQAVPLILPERPIIRTGMESLVINESGHSFQSFSRGFISYVSAQYVVILCDTLNKRLLV